MKRREFIALLGGAAAASAFSWPLPLSAQQPERMRRIGVLLGTAIRGDAQVASDLKAFERGLEELGWTAGRNILIEYRSPGGDPDRIRKDITELKPDVILTSGTSNLAALKTTGGTLPVVFVQVADPVGSGLVDSLARPGSNATGFTNYEYTMGGKWLELLKEIAPNVIRTVFVYNPDNAAWRGLLREIEAAARSLRVEVIPSGVHAPDDIERAIDTFAREPNGGLLAQPDGITVSNRELICALATRRGLPAVYPFRYFATSGGLMSYGVDVSEVYRQAASYVHRILRGQKPADLPVQAPTKFELVFNLKTAKALGLEVPPTLLARADEVIE